ncbi:hypothetical protein F5887DRAFT_973643 [Amanita rubescens]|nr:hypothetical protein F5887DRAFT_973643 [Amanita rubescens]
MTTSGSNKGSQKGYLVAQDIIKQFRQHLGSGQPSQAKNPDLKGEGKAEEPLSVEVNYVLVRPAGEREHKWVLPEGWEQRRNVYLLELPLDDEVQKRQRLHLPVQGSQRGSRTSARLKNDQINVNRLPFHVMFTVL